jgi:hypothetical protein
MERFILNPYEGWGKGGKIIVYVSKIDPIFPLAYSAGKYCFFSMMVLS